jgi:hypothetical protein
VLPDWFRGDVLGSDVMACEAPFVYHRLIVRLHLIGAPRAMGAASIAARVGRGGPAMYGARA